MFAFLAVYQALCALRSRAAYTADCDPDRISFTITVRLARDQACNQAAATPASLHETCHQTVSDLIDERLPARRARSYERIKRTPRNNHKICRHHHERPPSKVIYEFAITDDNAYQGRHAK
jgi:hypothetical protein